MNATEPCSFFIGGKGDVPSNGAQHLAWFFIGGKSDDPSNGVQHLACFFIGGKGDERHFQRITTFSTYERASYTCCAPLGGSSLAIK